MHDPDYRTGSPSVPAPPHYPGHRRWLRERLVRDGAERLSDYELLELLLFPNDPRHDLKPLARHLIKNFGGFVQVLRAEREMLRGAGVGLAGIANLKAACETATRVSREPLLMGRVHSSRDVVPFCHSLVGHSGVEECHVFYLDSHHGLLRHERPWKGTINHVPIYVREVLKRALELNAASLIIVHNHPAGDPQPSEPDIALTLHIISAAKPLGITLLDHLIIGRRHHTSMRELGIIDPPPARNPRRRRQ